MENDPLVGKQLGAYKIQAKLGEGGMARVYKAYHDRLRRDVAIKVILPQVADKAGFRERFEREAQLVASLTHPNIVSVYDFGELGNQTYLVMQYVGGGTLRDQLRKEGRIELRRAIHYTIQMARALHQAHIKGIVHRDVKPQNMLVSSSDANEILLSDFGIAKLFASGQEATLLHTPGSVRNNDLSLTNVDQMIGTAEYMAPEQINRQPVDARADVYALGIVLFQMLTGEIPFSSTTVQGLLFQHVYTPPKSVRELNPSVPEVLEQVIAKALAKAPEQRFQSAEAMAQALETLITPSTDQLAAPLSNPYATYSAYTTDQGRRETVGDHKGHLPTQHHSRPYYGRVGPDGRSREQSGLRATTANGGSIEISTPALPHARGKIRLSSVMLAIVVVLIVVYAIIRLIPLLPGGTGSGNSGCSLQVQPFTENFQNTNCNWPTGSLYNGNLTASINNNQYKLAVGTGTNTYFPNPSVMGPLPTNFTLTAQVTQNSGGAGVVYGLAFRLSQQGGNVYCYAFVIDGNGDYEVLKYNATTYSPLSGSGHYSTAIKVGANQSNTLQVTARGSTFSFMVNSTTVQVGANQKTTISDAAYTGGNLGLLVAGPNTSFTVTSVKLTTP